jgi:dUTPase
MSLRVQCHSTRSKLPVAKPNNTYEIYSAEEQVIMPNNIVAISTEISVSPPVGYAILVQSCVLVAKYNVETSMYSSLHESEYKFSDGSYRAPKLILFLHNKGEEKCIIRVGDPIGHLLLIRTRTAPIVEVDDINEADIGPSSHVVTIMQPKIKALPKTSMVWFKRMYRDNPTDVGAKYLTTEMLEEVNVFRTTEGYVLAKNQLNVEANFVWRLLSSSKDIKSRIKVDFDIVKHGPRTPDETKNPKKEAKKPRGRPNRPIHVSSDEDINDLAVDLGLDAEFD